MAEDDLLQRLKNYLVSQGLRPGDKIEAEVALAKKFSVSRHHIRQALMVMVQAGILERTPKRGTVIRNFDGASLSEHIQFQFEVARFDVSEFREARVLMERAILPLTVRRMTPEQIDLAQQSIDQLLLYQDKPEQADVFDRNFHLILFQACGNHALATFSEVISLLFRSSDYRSQYWTKEQIIQFANEHSMILAAIKRRDTLAAVAALDAHLRYWEICMS